MSHPSSLSIKLYCSAVILTGGAGMIHHAVILTGGAGIIHHAVILPGGAGMILDVDTVAGSPWAPEARGGSRASPSRAPLRALQAGRNGQAAIGGTAGGGGGVNALIRQKPAARLSTGNAVVAGKAQQAPFVTSKRGAASRRLQRASLDGADLVSSHPHLVSSHPDIHSSTLGKSSSRHPLIYT